MAKRKDPEDRKPARPGDEKEDGESASLEEKLGYSFRKKKLLRQALTHSSAKDADHPSNERLEFLGDAVLGMIVTEELFKAHPDLDEGELTAIKSIVVSSASLEKTARKLGIRPYLIVGKGISSGRSLPPSLAANAVEAIIGAVFKDSGIRAARRFVKAHFGLLAKEALRRRRSLNYKSRLQYYAQKKFGITPYYRVLSMDGPDHRMTFTLSAVVGSREFPPGRGRTKKDAGQHAAREALKILKEEYGRIPDPR